MQKSDQYESNTKRTVAYCPGLFWKDVAKHYHLLSVNVIPKHNQKCCWLEMNHYFHQILTQVGVKVSVLQAFCMRVIITPWNKDYIRLFTPHLTAYFHCVVTQRKILPIRWEINLQMLTSIVLPAGEIILLLSVKINAHVPVLRTCLCHN